MEISKGMYIRTEDGYIGKCIDIDSDNFMFFDKPVYKNFSDTFYSCYLSNIDIKKASFNIIDLIKDGDYANGYPVVQIMDCYENDTKRDLGRTIYIDKPCAGVKIGWTPLLNGNIKDVVTKEQFNSMKYVVERDK